MSWTGKKMYERDMAAGFGRAESRNSKAMVMKEGISTPLSLSFYCGGGVASDRAN